MNSVLQDLFAPSLAKAIEENLHELLATSLQWPRAQVTSSPELEWFISGNDLATLGAVGWRPGLFWDHSLIL